jgi:transposase
MDAPFTPSSVRFYIGIDVASETLAIAVTTGPGRPALAALTVTNDPEGFAAFDEALRGLGAGTDDTLVCLEATGVYGEALCYWLHGRGYHVVVEDASKVQRAMPIAGAKTDALDARRIADYAARFLDELRPWTPAEAVVEQVQTLLTMREQLVREKGAKQNALHVLRRKAVPTPLALRIAEDAVAYLAERVKEIDREVHRLVSEHPTIGPAVALLVSIPGVGLLLVEEEPGRTSAWRRAGSRARSRRSSSRHGSGSARTSTRAGRASGGERGAGATARARCGSCSTSRRCDWCRSRVRRTGRTSSGRRRRGRAVGSY